MNNVLTRRQLLTSAVLGASALGLRTLASGLPLSLLLNPRRALADGMGTCGADKAQYVIFNTSGQGDPINANAPGTYDLPEIYHCPDPALAPKPILLGGAQVMAGGPWSTLPQAVLDRMAFFHLMTDTPVHPKEPDVLKLQGTAKAGEMLPSLLARNLAPCLGTVQTQPISLGASTPSEGLTFGGQALPIIPALALKATLTSPEGPLTDLRSLRDDALAQIYDVYRDSATPAQRAYIDSLVTSQGEVRGIRQDLLGQLSSITDNSPASQITAALTLIQMKLTPVVAIHIPFGGDNHRDIDLATEAAETVSGVASIVSLMDALSRAGLADQVTVASLNVFGRTLGPASANGRQHNAYHQVSFAIGKPFKGGVIGGLQPVDKDFGCTAVDSKTGASSKDGDVSEQKTLPSFGKTLLAGAGVDPAVIDDQVSLGTVISGALA